MICSICKQEYNAEFHVFEHLWKWVVEKEGDEICIECFDEMCRKKGLLPLWKPTIITDLYKAEDIHLKGMGNE